MQRKYELASGTQVREEDFGLLFYTMRGPRLHFLSSGPLLSCSFFGSGLTLERWVEIRNLPALSKKHYLALKRGLEELKNKGVLIEC